MSRKSPKLIVHEMGHLWAGLLDDYKDKLGPCPQAISNGWTLCGHSIMDENRFTNKNGFCTALGHGTNQEDWRGFTLSDQGTPHPFISTTDSTGIATVVEWTNPPPSINGPKAYDCDGVFEKLGANSDWSGLNAHIPTEPHPVDWSPHNHAFEQFWANPLLGKPLVGN